MNKVRTEDAREGESWVGGPDAFGSVATTSFVHLPGSPLPVPLLRVAGRLGGDCVGCSLGGSRFTTSSW